MSFYLSSAGSYVKCMLHFYVVLPTFLYRSEVWCPRVNEMGMLRMLAVKKGVAH